MQTAYESGATLDVIRERVRQQSKEGWTAEHDDKHTKGELAKAAACYAVYETEPPEPNLDWDAWLAAFAGRIWPFDFSWWKPKSRRRNLVRAAALIIAEIERLDRAEERKDG